MFQLHTEFTVSPCLPCDSPPHVSQMNKLPPYKQEVKQCHSAITRKEMEDGPLGEPNTLAETDGP